MELPISGVRTTGIYCRDGCSGRPHARNVTRFPSPVAAEAAGLRPCLVCRPDRLPPVLDGNAEALVGRALLLIAEGALDEETEDTLAPRLGVTARHLRRLFNERVGATPAFVARSRRAHFARRLLDETDLRITEIADASGFNSVRQMNRVILEVFRFTPLELRAKRRQADRLIADGGLALRVPYSGPLAFRHLLAYLAPRAIPGVESVDLETKGGTYRRTFTTCGEPGVIEVSQGQVGGRDQHLSVVAHLPTFRALIDDVARCRRLFGLDRPASEAAALAADPLLGDVVRANPGVRVPGAWDPFEIAVRIILGQQVSVAGATTMAGRLVEEFGTPVPGLEAMGLSHVFPAATTLASASVDRLQSLGLTGARARTIRDVARAYSEERVRLDPGVELDELIASLEALPGIGPWTAQMIALRAAGQPDAFASGDLGLRRAVGRLAGLEGPADAAEVERVAEAWRPHRALASMYLWMSR